ncbi:MAG: DUF5110 domain-containing protein [Clostridiaceae bacterium]|nr:DUF5110 domain-containing protein [Clostridiaceae bacterium]
MDSITIVLPDGNTLTVSAVTSRSFRVRIAKEYDRESALNRYDIIPETPPVDCRIAQSEIQVTLETAFARLVVSKVDGGFVLERLDGSVLTATAGVPVNRHGSGFSLALKLHENTRVYGLGDVTRERIEKTGYKYEMWVKDVISYVPIPVVLTSEGWGMLLNTTWHHSFDVGCTRKDELRMHGGGGELDVYLFVGDDYRTLLNEYTSIFGRPAMLPHWAYGLTYVCNQQVNAREMMEDCMNFRREGIPCDIVGLEPGWMSKYYDTSVEKTWHPERFYVPYWAPKGDHTFFGALERLGFKLSLWLCCDYDLSFEEERQYAMRNIAKNSAGSAATAGNQEFHEDSFEKDVNLIKGPLSMDKITKVDEPWFEHLKKFVDQGVSCFKLDAAYQAIEHPDRKWGNGMDDEEMHNLYPVIYNKQMNRGFSDYTGRRAMIYSSCGYTGIQRYSATWAGDTGGGPKPLVSMLNHGFSGHNNVSCDMDVFSPQGIHFGFFQTWSQLNNWAYWRQPWYLTGDLKQMFKFYARLRYRLIPYIYTAVHEASQTGYPVMRAMSMEYPDMAGADELLHQYMFGDDLLTGAFTEKITLPRGRWTDAWTGKAIEGGCTVPCEYPGWAGGPLYVKDGAIIPTSDDVQWLGDSPLGHVTLSIYPSREGRIYTLYEDDGISLDYLKGEYATTRICTVRRGNEVQISIGAREGSYKGMPGSRRYTVDIHGRTQAKEAILNGKAIPFTITHEGWCAHYAEGFIRVELPASADAIDLRVKFDD